MSSCSQLIERVASHRQGRSGLCSERRGGTQSESVHERAPLSVETELSEDDAHARGSHAASGHTFALLFEHTCWRSRPAVRVPVFATS